LLANIPVILSAAVFLVGQLRTEQTIGTSAHPAPFIVSEIRTLQKRTARKATLVFGFQLTDLIVIQLRQYRLPLSVIPAKVVTPKFESELESTYSDNYKKYPHLLEGFNAHVSFAMTWEYGNSHYHIETDVHIREEIQEANRRLIEKISKKFDQHRESPYRLLIVIGIEELFSSHEKSRTIPIRKDNINSDAIHGLLKYRAVLWLIFKEYKPKGVVYKTVVFGNQKIDRLLMGKLNSINQEITYSTNT